MKFRTENACSLTSEMFHLHLFHPFDVNLGYCVLFIFTLLVVIMTRTVLNCLLHTAVFLRLVQCQVVQHLGTMSGGDYGEVWRIIFYNITERLHSSIVVYSETKTSVDQLM